MTTSGDETCMHGRTACECAVCLNRQIFGLTAHASSLASALAARDADVARLEAMVASLQRQNAEMRALLAHRAEPPAVH